MFILTFKSTPVAQVYCVNSVSHVGILTGYRNMDWILTHPRIGMKRLIPILTIWFNCAPHLSIPCPEGCLHTHWTTSPLTIRTVIVVALFLRQWCNIYRHQCYLTRKIATVSYVYAKESPWEPGICLWDSYGGKSDIKQCLTDPSRFLISAPNIFSRPKQKFQAESKSSQHCSCDQTRATQWFGNVGK